MKKLTSLPNSETKSSNKKTSRNFTAGVETGEFHTQTNNLANDSFVIVMTLREWSLLLQAVMKQLEFNLEKCRVNLRIDWSSVAQKTSRSKSVCEYVWNNYQQHHFRINSNLIVMDASAEALEEAKTRHEESVCNVRSFCDDVQRRMKNLQELIDQQYKQNQTQDTV